MKNVWITLDEDRELLHSIVLKSVIPFAILLICFAGSAYPGEIVSGTVTDAFSGESLAAVNIVVEGINRGAATDRNGEYRIEELPHGKHRLIASMLGYETAVRIIEIEHNQPVMVDFLLEESPLEMQSVVVTGTRTPRFVRDAPVRTEVITQKAIEQKSAGNLYEALEGSPGIRVEQQCQFCLFTQLRMQGLGADHTQVLMDGQPVYSGLASVYGLQQLSTAEISQIEIVKGAGSALYGSNAIAGAINIISQKPTKTSASAGLEIGEYGTNRYDFTASTRKGNIGLFLFAQQNLAEAIDQTRDGIGSSEIKETDGISDRVKTDNRTAGANLYIDNVTRMDELTIRGRILNEHRQGGEIPDDVYENPFTAGTEQIVTERFSGDAGYRKWFSTGNEFSINLSYSHHERNATNDTFLGDYEEIHGTLPPVDILRPYMAEEDLYVTTLNYIHPLGDAHRLLTGLQYTRNELGESGKYIVVDDTDPDYTEQYTSYSEKQADDFGVYLQDEYKITPELELVSGVRFDHHKSKDSFRGSGDVVPTGVEPVEYDENAVNPRFAVKYAYNDEITLRGSFGTGFKVPYGFSEDLHLCSGSPRIWKGSDLKPEKSVSYTVSADYSTSRLGLNLNLFMTELTDAVSAVDAGDDAGARGYTYEYQNIDNASVMGADFGAQYALTRDLAIMADLSLYHGEYDKAREDWIGTEYEEDSRKISRYPTTSGGLKIEYSPHKWSFVLDGDYQGMMFIDYYAETDPSMTKIKETEPFVIFNTQVSRRFNDSYRLYVGAHNLTDYIQEEKHIDDAAFMYAPVYGRIVYGGIKITLQ